MESGTSIEHQVLLALNYTFSNNRDCTLELTFAGECASKNNCVWFIVSSTAIAGSLENLLQSLDQVKEERIRQVSLTPVCSLKVGLPIIS